MVIGQNIVRIGKNAFYGCKKLTSITIKSSRLTLKNIGKNAFKGCKYLKKITIGSNVLIAPNVQLYTATHPIDLDERLAPFETEDGIKRVRRTYALPITIEDGCWIGGGK